MSVEFPQVCLVGKSRSYELSDEAEYEQQRVCYIQSRQTSPIASVQRSEVQPIESTSASAWGAGFQPRDRVETVRNCAALPRDFVDRVVLQVADVLLGMSDGVSCSDWNKGGSLSVREVAGLLEQETLQLLKKECGGLQTLLKNNHQVFRVEGGRVYIRDWRDRKSTRTQSQRTAFAPGALKTRLCWFYSHHPQGCPLLDQNCAFAHGPDDLRPSTRPLKKTKNFVF
uniref:tRNA (uracil-O(2)-)-methyltransferase n=1 Tax=Iconisemion striatum TaxID=60296 RepID=A0A1A7XRY9_9TELE